MITLILASTIGPFLLAPPVPINCADILRVRPLRNYQQFTEQLGHPVAIRNETTRRGTPRPIMTATWGPEGQDFDVTFYQGGTISTSYSSSLQCDPPRR